MRKFAAPIPAVEFEAKAAAGETGVYHLMMGQNLHLFFTIQAGGDRV